MVGAWKIEITAWNSHSDNPVNSSCSTDLKASHTGLRVNHGECRQWISRIHHSPFSIAAMFH
jgi:hypothetical protein